MTPTIALLLSLLFGGAASLSMQQRPPRRVPIVGNSYLSSLEQYTVAMESAKAKPEELPLQYGEILAPPAMTEVTAEEEPTEENDKENLLQKIKNAGIAGVVSYGLVQTLFWGVSTLIVLYGYTAVEGHFPDFSNQEELAKLGAEAFAYVNIVRFTIPFRIGLALSATPWVQANLVDRFTSKKEDKEIAEEETEDKENLLEKIKTAGVAGLVSYGVVQLVFWAASIPVVLFGFYAVTGHFPDFSNDQDKAKLGAEAFAYVNLVRVTVPAQIGLALSATPWVQSNLVDQFGGNGEDQEESLQ